MTLLGAWIVDLSDVRARTDLGDVMMEFKSDGQLIYVIRSDRTDQVISLRYQLDGDTLVTNQPSAPKLERH